VIGVLRGQLINRLLQALAYDLKDSVELKMFAKEEDGAEETRPKKKRPRKAD